MILLDVYDRHIFLGNYVIMKIEYYIQSGIIFIKYALATMSLSLWQLIYNIGCEHVSLNIHMYAMKAEENGYSQFHVHC